VAPPAQLPDGLERTRVLAARVFLGLIVSLIVASTVGLTRNVDLGVFGTLVGGELALLGAGVVVKLFGAGK
jgi:hypothetical protein